MTSLSTTVTARPQPASHSGHVRKTIFSSDDFFKPASSFADRDFSDRDISDRDFSDTVSVMHSSVPQPTADQAIRIRNF